MKECPACHRCFPDQVNHCPSDGGRLKFLIHLDNILDERYQLESKLGQGGMGMVFKARHVFIKTQHAIKIILPDLVGNDPSLTARFRQEAMAAAAIRHPNTVSVTDYGILNDTTPYLVMEFVEGRSLHDMLSAEKRIAWAQAVEIMLAVCAGVGAAHQQGIVHRDLKPLNIMLKTDMPPSESVKVLDFGLAKIKSGELLGSFVAAQTQGMMGSPFYMAPEQWGDEDIDARSDIYSLGVILYQMLAGDVPFKGNTIPSIMNKHLNTSPVPLSERGVEVPEPLESAVRHALEKDPLRRPQSIEEFAAELRAALPSLSMGDAVHMPGAPTTRIGSSGTVGLGAHSGPGAGGPHEIPESLKTVAGKPGTVALEGDPRQPGGGGVLGASEAMTEALTEEARLARSGDTARQRQARTGGQVGEAMTEPLPGSADTQRERAEAELRRQREDEELRHRETKERQRLEAEERDAANAAQQRIAEAPPVPQLPGTPAPARSGALYVVLGALVGLVLLIAIGGVTVYVIKNRRTEPTPTPTPTQEATPTVTPTPKGASETTRPDLVALAGGSFKVGRDDVPQLTDELMKERPAYLLWIYNQWPAHAAIVKPFAIDRTEVTNAEYAEFVKATSHAPPKGWEGDTPKAGEERLPVSNVSFDDARAFAEWRSKRDGAAYRLPTEAEWEFAARGNSSRPYPWEGSFVGNRAAIVSGSPSPVGTFPDGATPEGALDMLGNVWEWTSSEAAMYKGNNRTVLGAGDRGKMVVRGGSYESKLDGDEPITVTSRRWVAKDARSPVLGFRLVRVEP
ncbi:MAG: SUMF1/EgtB/PvdO family nonheme iron enzyme [Rubrivivax sp.]|nr:SUMF1/EgtB/PvdO family nonheme iron enzyme [Pyrinomonadaceae bacterium]